jgi:GTPase SAR1 family protein
MSDGYPVVICGNKADMEDAREVSKEDGQALAQKLNCPFFETSAKVPRPINTDHISR